VSVFIPSLKQTKKLTVSREKNDRCLSKSHRRIARSLSGVHFSCSKKLATFLVVAPPKTLRAKSTKFKLTTPTLQISPISLKIGLFLCLGVHLQLSLVNLAQFFSPPWGCMCTQCTPWLRLWLKYVHFITLS